MAWARSWLAVALALVVAGCASTSTLPPALRAPPPDNPSPAAARSEPEQYQGRAVRWGGTIARVDNRENETWVEVVGRRLEYGGRPYGEDYSTGRFMAVLPGFHDPVILAEGRELTVAGTVDGVIDGRIGEHRYSFPVVRAAAHHLWAPLPEYPYYSYHSGYYWHHPWWHYGFGHHRHYRHHW